MGFYFSKSKFVSAAVYCNKHAWLEKYKPSEKKEAGEFVQSLFDNGHRVGELAKEYLNVDVDVTSFDSEEKLDLTEMIRKTDYHINSGTKKIAEASFSFGGFFCSVDILEKNDDHTYNIYEVKSSTRKATKKNPVGVKERYILDAAYQQFVLSNCGLKISKVYIVLLDENYIREKDFEIDKYFVKCDVTDKTNLLQTEIQKKLSDIGSILDDKNEPDSVICENCNGCEYWNYCSRGISHPSVFDLYGLKFSEKCDLYNAGVSFFDVPKVKKIISVAANHQIEYFNRPKDTYIDKTEIQKFFDTLNYPLYSLDFETYQAVVPEYKGMKTYEQVPFQYSLHIVNDIDADIDKVEEYGFLDISGKDTRRAIAESLVENIPFGAAVIAFHSSTEENIIKRLAKYCPDLAAHLLSFEYKDPLELFKKGFCYNKAMGNSFSLKSIAPALYPLDKDMDYHNLEGNVKNGTQAMNVFYKLGNFTEEEQEQLAEDLKKYCALDTLAVVKILYRLYEFLK